MELYYLRWIYPDLPEAGGEWSYADFSNTTGLKASVIAAQYGNNLMGPVTISQATWDSYTTEEQEQIKNYVTVKPNRNHTGG